MKNKLKIIIALMIVTFSMQSFGQLTYGPRIGVNFANQNFDIEGEEPDTKMLTAFAIGGTVDYAFNDAMSLQPSLLFSVKGYKIDYSDSEDGYDVTGDAKSKLNYFEIPINFVYKYDIGALKIYGAAGPYFAFALSGKYDYEYTMSYGGETETESGNSDIKFGDGEDEDGIKRGDIGLNIGAGVEINSFQVGLNYGFGMTNTMYTDSYKAKNAVFSITACYFFGGGF